MPKVYSYELKKSVVNFYKSELWDIMNALKIFQVSKSSMYSWIDLDKNNLLLETSNVRCNYERKIYDEVEMYIVTYVTKKVNFVHKNLKRCIKKIFDIKISGSSVYRILQKYNITNKKIHTKFVPKNKNIKKEVKDLIEKVKMIGIHNITSIDEASFDTHIHPNNGWSKKGTPIKKILTPIRKRKTLTLAVKTSGVMAYNLINGSSNAINFEKFIREDVLPKLNNETILMDNVKFHHSAIVKNPIIESGNNILYNVAYNPDTNPIENCFSVSKNYVRKSQPITENALIVSIEKSLKLLTPEKLTNMFNNSFNNL